MNKLFQYCQVGYFSPLSLNQNYLDGRMNLYRKLSAFLYLTQEKGWDFCISHKIKILELICYLKYFISIVLQQYILIVTSPFWLYQSSIIYYKTMTIEIGIYCSVICHNKCSWYFLFYQNSKVISRQKSEWFVSTIPSWNYHWNRLLPGKYCGFDKNHNFWNTCYFLKMFLVSSTLSLRLAMVWSSD